MLTELIIWGFGGQGVLFAGKCLAYSAMLKEMHISWLPSYGPEMRGGTANCSVCLSDEPIGSPLVTEPDILIAMNDPSVEKFIGNVKSGGKVFVDSGMTEAAITRSDIEVYRIPASQTAEEKGLGGMANIILLGKMLKECKTLGVIDANAVISALREIIPASRSELIDKNISALLAGEAL